MKKFGVIVAGGSGLRMGTQIPKQFLLIHGRPVIFYTLKTFLDAYEDLQIILVLPGEYLEAGRQVVTDLSSGDRIRCTAGGATRFHSVQRGLELIQEPSVIFVHDGVRCLLSTDLIHRCFEATMREGSAIPCVHSRDSVRLINETGSTSLNRASIKLVQTPQTFRSDLLLPAYRSEYRESFTDDASVVEHFQHAVHLVEGEINNIKITTPLDLILAAALLDSPEDTL